MMARAFAYAFILAAILTRAAWGLVTSDAAGTHVTIPGTAYEGVPIDGVVALVEKLEADDEWFLNCTGSLIADRYVMTAAHCFDEDRNGEIDDVYLDSPQVASFDLVGGRTLIPFSRDSIQIAPDWWQTERLADLAVLELEASAPAEVPRYPLYGGRNEVGNATAHIGYGWTGAGATGAEEPPDRAYPVKRAGRNRIELAGWYELYHDFDSGQPENNTLAFLGYTSDLGFGVDEVFTGPKDSGSPVFIDNAIAAVTSLGFAVPETDVTTDPDSSWGEVGEDVRVSSFRSFLVDATQGQARWVGVAGDFDHNGILQVEDIDLLTVEVRLMSHEPEFDLVPDGIVDLLDQSKWVKDLKRTWFGDANLNREFDSADLVQVMAQGEYEDVIVANSTWASGDWNADAEFTSSDLVVAFQDGGYEMGVPAALPVVPEPSACTLLYTGVALTWIWAMRKRSARVPLSVTPTGLQIQYRVYRQTFL